MPNVKKAEAEEAAADEQALMREALGNGHAAGAIRALAKRIGDLGDRLTKAEEEGGRELSSLSQSIVDLDRSLVARIDRLEKEIGRVSTYAGRVDGSTNGRLEALEAKALGHDAAIRGLDERALAMVKDFDGRLSALVSRTEGIPQLRREVVGSVEAVACLDRALRLALARIGELERKTSRLPNIDAEGLAIPAPSSSADLDQRDRQPIPLSAVRCTCGDATRPGIHRFDEIPCSTQEPATGGVVPPRTPPYRMGEPGFLSPPPLARAIGEAVKAGIAYGAAARRAAEAKVLGERLALVLRTIPVNVAEAHSILSDSIVEARRAGVIP